jgi:hypothetical protein
LAVQYIRGRGIPMSIRDQKLLYHLTSLNNLESILENGLISREEIDIFDDVANSEIITFRKLNGLNDYIPFHFFTRNPFDGRVQIDYPFKEFIYITVHRNYAEENNFKIIPIHPKAMRPLILYDYEEGFNLIDWDIMDTKNYHDEDCKHICMAECLSPRAIQPDEFQSIFVKTPETKEIVEEACMDIFGRVPFWVNVNRSMFVE